MVVPRGSWISTTSKFGGNVAWAADVLPLTGENFKLKMSWITPARRAQLVGIPSLCGLWGCRDMSASHYGIRVIRFHLLGDNSNDSLLAFRRTLSYLSHSSSPTLTYAIPAAVQGNFLAHPRISLLVKDLLPQLRPRLLYWITCLLIRHIFYLVYIFICSHSSFNSLGCWIAILLIPIVSQIALSKVSSLVYLGAL